MKRKQWARLLCYMLVALLGLQLLGASLLASKTEAAAVSVQNGIQFKDTSGNVIHAHGGGVIKVGSYYYWFGENRNSDGTFNAVSCYRSTDLRTWEFRNDVLTKNSAAELNVSNIERPKVIYNSSTGNFVLWMHWENGVDYGQARTAVAYSSTVDGNYTYQGSFRPLGYDSRDMTVYNDNGTAYLISATRVNADLNIYKLTSDFLGVDSLVQTLWAGQYREAPAMFKRNGVYFLVTSGATGWDPNQGKYATATSITGTWSGLSNFGDSTTYDSQSAYVLPIEGSSTTSFLYMGDRWGGAMGSKVMDSRYVWLPLTFPTSTSLSMSWGSSVTIDTATGTITASSPAIDTSAYYLLENRNSGRDLNVRSQGTANGDDLEQYMNNGWYSGQWQFVSAGSGYYKIVNRNSGRLIGVSSGSTADGAIIEQWADGGWTSQQWQIIDSGGGNFKLKNRATGKLIDISGGSKTDGANAIQWTDNGGKNQQFRLLKVE
ncbi:RICIN domain-containing protein [Paenibacillus sedimenti]|uniref:RICIN domain-containing protein n=1 Tax=Paenibacillus sedimenti TaxID=2770274 RepID=A0A926QGY8_9BACL|nr:RICIN domain-containing protein [Paenibacillus sedimenti]MBD0378956.1 RICIN domain-containing protein [Paenibacillus sedimenti]